MISATEIIQRYSLEQHPEGGWYKQTYKSKELIPAEALPAGFGGERSFATAIYFLLERNDFSAFHRIKSDECWHFYAGGALNIYEIFDDGQMKIIELGADMAKGQMFQYVVSANHWFASKPARGSDFCFVGCTVSPGFDFSDFEIANREALQISYPQHAALIEELSG